MNQKPIMQDGEQIGTTAVSDSIEDKIQRVHNKFSLTYSSVVGEDLVEELAKLFEDELQDHELKEMNKALQGLRDYIEEQNQEIEKLKCSLLISQNKHESILKLYNELMKKK